MNNDYNQNEIDLMLNELLTVQAARFNKFEILYFETLQKMDKVSNGDRDRLVSIYDRVRDN